METYIEVEQISISLPCRTSLNVLRYGKPDGPACVLLHGLDNNAHIWDSVVETLEQSFLVYAIDIRGHGDSDWSDPLQYTKDNLVQDIESVRQHFKLDTFHLIGHSLGALLAVHYMKEHSSYISKLVLVDVGVGINPEVLNKMRDNHKQQIESFPSTDLFHEHLQQIYMLADTEALHSFSRHSYTYKNGRYLNKTDPKFKDKFFSDVNGSNLLRDDNIWQILPTINAPTLLIRGEHSSVLSEMMAKKILELIKTANLATINKAGHAVMLDNPKRLTAIVDKFLKWEV